MADKVYVVGAYVSNEDPLLRIHAFVPLTTEHATLDEAVAAAEQDFRRGHAPAADLAFAVYRSDAGDAIVEVTRGRPFRTAGLYKVAWVEAGEGDAG